MAPAQTFCLLLLGFLSTLEVGAILPGTQIQISQRALDYAANVAIGEISRDLVGTTIPNVKGDSRLRVGKVEYELTNMRMTRWVKPGSRLSIDQGQGLSWAATGAETSLHGNWRYKYKWGFIRVRDSGRFEVDVDRVSFDIGVDFDGNGRPTIRTRGCSSDVGDARVKFLGGASWLYNLFRRSAQRMVKNNLRRVMCTTTTDATNNRAAQGLASMKVQVPLGKALILDYRLVAPPTFDPNYMQTHHKGVVYWTVDRKDPPFSSLPIHDLAGSTKMVNIAISQFLFNSMGHSMQRIPEGSDGALSKTFTKDDLPNDRRDILNTTCTGLCLGSLIPQIGQQFPNRFINLHMKSTRDPFITFNAGAISGQFQGDIKIRVPGENGQHTNLITCNTTLSLAFIADIKDNKLLSRVNAFSIGLDITQSNIANVEVSTLEFIANIVSEIYIIPKLNEMGAKGLVIPSLDGIHFVNPGIVIEEGTLIVSTDLRYQAV